MERIITVLKQQLLPLLENDKTKLSDKQICKEIDKIKIVACQFMIEVVNSTDVSHAVAWLQKSLISYMNSCWQTVVLSPHHKNENSIIEQCNQIADIILELENEFKECFNYDAFMPQTMMHKLKSEYGAQTKKVEAHLQSLKISQKLIDIALYPFHRLMSDECSHEPINSFFYGNAYYKSLMKFGIRESMYHEKDVAFSRYLISLNCNCQHLVTYLNDWMSSLLRSKTSVAEELDTLYILDAGLAEIYPRIAYDFKRNRETIKETLSGILKRRICQCKTFLAGHDPLKATEEPCCELVDTTFSVKELALFTRLMVEEGLIKTETNTILYKKICKSFRTPKTAEISLQSFENKTSTIDHVTVTKVKTSLARLMERLDKIKYDLNYKDITRH